MMNIVMLIKINLYVPDYLVMIIKSQYTINVKTNQNVSHIKLT